MTAKETLYETRISDERWWAYDIPGNAGWIAYLAYLFHSLKRGLNTFNMAALQKIGVNYEQILGEGMFHCYPVFPIVKEAREGWRQMAERMIRWRDET